MTFIRQGITIFTKLKSFAISARFKSLKIGSLSLIPFKIPTIKTNNNNDDDADNNNNNLIQTYFNEIIDMYERRIFSITFYYYYIHDRRVRFNLGSAARMRRFVLIDTD